MLKSLVLPVFFHGLYDFFLIQKSFEGLAILSILALSVSITLARRLIHLNQDIHHLKIRKMI